MILTRYLYPKNNAVYSLHIAIINQQDIQEANFWAYELYYSGFRAETIELLIDIYDYYFKQEPVKPALQKWLSKKYTEWQSDMTQDHIIASIIENIFKRQPEGAPENPRTQTPIFIVAKEPKFPTILAEYTKGWKLPQKVCAYACYREPNSTPPLNIDDFTQNWILYASGSPIWRTRVKKYGGKITADSVIFPDEDSEQEFRNWFDMEPDEQPTELQEAWIGV